MLYLLDFSHWPPGCGSFLRKVGTFAVLLCIAGGGLLTMADFPYLPLGMAMLLMPFGAFFLVGCLFSKKRIDDVSCAPEPSPACVLLEARAPAPLATPDSSPPAPFQAPGAGRRRLGLAHS